MFNYLQMRSLGGGNKSDEDDNTKDAYADLAPDPVGPSTEVIVKRDWLSEFPDESVTPAPKRPTSPFSEPGRSLGEEDR